MIKHFMAVTALFLFLALMHSAWAGKAPGIVWSSLYDKAEELYSAGSFTEALGVVEQALEKGVARSGYTHINIVRTLNLKGLICLELNMLERAESCFKRGLEAVASLEDPESEMQNVLIMHLAVVYRESGHTEEAISILKIAISNIEKTSPLDNELMLTLLNSMAVAYADLGENDVAELIYLRCVELAEDSYGLNHKKTATYMNNLSALYADAGRYDSALALQQRAVDINKQIYGDCHYSTFKLYINLAKTGIASGGDYNYEYYYKKILSCCNDNPDLVIHALPFVLYYKDKHYQAGEYESSLARIEEAIFIGRIIYDEDSVEMANYYYTKGHILYRLGRLVESYAYNEMSMDILAGLNHIDSGLYINALYNKGVIELDSKEYTKSAETWRTVIPMIVENAQKRALYANGLVYAVAALLNCDSGQEAEEYLAEYIKITELANPDSKPRLGVLWFDTSEGVRVCHVFEGSAASINGVKVGDIILSVNGENAESREAAGKLVSEVASNMPMTLSLLRDGNILNIDIAAAR